MRIDLRMLAAGLMFAGCASAVTDGTHAPDVPPTAPSTPAAAAAPIVAQAARAVLDGVGIESGLERARVSKALASLSDHVAVTSHPEALQLAFRAYFNYRDSNPGRVKKPYLYFVDYGLDSRTPRGYVFDMETLTVVDGPFQVAHGRGSQEGGSAVPTRFSNRKGSNATSLGLYLAQETYAFRGKSGGRAYRSIGLRLAGVSGEYNSAARARGVVVHGAPYVTASRAGRSEGCPAMEPSRAEKLIPMIADGGMVFHFSPLDREWMASDRWANLATLAATSG